MFIIFRDIVVSCTKESPPLPYRLDLLIILQQQQQLAAVYAYGSYGRFYCVYA